MNYKKLLVIILASMSLFDCAIFTDQKVKADSRPFNYFYHYSHSDYSKHDSSIEIKTTRKIVMKRTNKKYSKFYGHKIIKKGTILRADAMNYGWYLWYPGWIYPHKTTDWFKVVYMQKV